MLTKMDKKVLIVTYYWPPSGGSGVQRWLKFVKYLPEFGWNPIVFIPENPSYTILDESLARDVPPSAEILKFPIWEPYQRFHSFSKLIDKQPQALKPSDIVSGGRASFFRNMSTWIRGNLFIPDPRRFWVRPAVRFLDEFMRYNKIRTVVTTGPPHSMHLIGYRLKKKYPNIRWLADFRDPWSQWGFLDSLRVGSLARRVHQHLEAKVLTTADEVITITPFYAEHFRKLSHRQIRLLTNGFDEDDFKTIRFSGSPVFLIRHIGTINERCDPRPFMAALKALMTRDELFGNKVRLEFIGEVNPVFKAEVIGDTALNKITTFIGPVAHDELISRYGDSSLLLMVLNGYKDAEGYMPGKLFEYIATGIPVLGIGPSDGDAAKLLRETGAGEMVDASSMHGIERVLMLRFQNWNGEPAGKPIGDAAMKYSRRAITGMLTELL
jgi:glycosyltransferase involved in cell wall biosynthesis